MSSHRNLRVAEAIREVVANAILFEVHDPRVKNVTVLAAEVSPDIRQAKVFVTVTGDNRDERRVMQGLQSARGFLQAKVAARLQTRVTPELKFEIDNSAKRTSELLKLIESTVSADTGVDTESTEDDPDPVALQNENDPNPGQD
ncbi:30S ribosome-binding factor RbfA [bacterium]|nr:30S ribosome-binding factor RbfA [bacterium]